MPPSFSVMQPSVQALIDEQIALIKERQTGMAAFRETKTFVSQLTAACPSMRLVVTILLPVYHVLSAEAQRLSGHSGVPIQIILLGLDDSYMMTPTQAGMQPILRTGTGGFGGIAPRVSGAGTQHMAMKARCMSRSCRRCRTPYLAALAGRPSCLPCLQPPRRMCWPRSTCPQRSALIWTRGW